jgi:hypothetical protein
MTTRLITWGAMIGAATALMLSLAILLAARPERSAGSRPIMPAASDTIEAPIRPVQSGALADRSGLSAVTLRSITIFEASLH